MRLMFGLLLADLGLWRLRIRPDAHIAAAKAAAGDDFQNLFNFQCYGPGPGGPRAAAGAQRGPAAWASRAGRGHRVRRTDPHGTPSR